MAVFNSATVDRLNTIEDSKIRAYLYKLNEDLTYMFNNLTPSDNYSEAARLLYVQEGEKISSLEVSVEGIKANVVYKDKVVAAINLSTEGVKIKGDKISLEGVVTANEYFKIELDGSMTAVNGTFKGNISAGSKISGSEIIGGSASFGDDLFFADDNLVGIGGFYAKKSWGRYIFQSNDGQCGMSANPGSASKLWFWAGWQSDDNYDFCVNNLGEVHARDFYIETDSGFWKGWGLNETFQDIYERIEALESQL